MLRVFVRISEAIAMGGTDLMCHLLQLLGRLIGQEQQSIGLASGLCFERVLELRGSVWSLGNEIRPKRAYVRLPVDGHSR